LGSIFSHSTRSFNGQNYQVYVRKRPYLDHFLKEIARKYEVILFTASQKVYADVLMNKLDPHKAVDHRLFRESCLLVQGNYLKDLTVLDRKLNTVMLVDNSPHAYSYQPDNGVPIESWYDDPEDTELLKLLEFLKSVEGAIDVQPIIRNKFKTWERIRDSKMGRKVNLATPPF
jgi:CTD small phosphatase-like protein 2